MYISTSWVYIIRVLVLRDHSRTLYCDRSQIRIIGKDHERNTDPILDLASSGINFGLSQRQPVLFVIVTGDVEWTMLDLVD